MALAETARELVEPAARELGSGYADLVRRLRASRALEQIAREDGIDAVLGVDDPTIATLRKANRELATDAERRAEAAMRRFVSSRFPRHEILGEELGAMHGTSGAAGDADDRCLWVFDPVDGTSAMVRSAIADAFGLDLDGPAPGFGITLGVLRDQHPVVGVVAQLRSDAGRLTVAHVWVGARGQPTTRDGVPVTVPAPPPLAGAVLASTVPEVMFVTGEQQAAFASLRASTQALLVDQNCVGYMRLLDGGVGVVCEADLTLPDAVALIAPLTGAGIVVTDHHGDPLRFGAARGGEYRLLAAAPPVHAQALVALDEGRRAAAGGTASSPGAFTSVHAGYARKLPLDPTATAAGLGRDV